MKKKYNVATIFIAKTGIIAALYAVLTIAFAPISYGAIQCRVSEAMTLLPLFFVEAIPGLIIGCLISNIFSGVLMDMVFGTLATAIASVLTFYIGKWIKGKGKPFIAGIPPVLANAFILPIMWKYFTPDGGFYWFNMATVAAGQIIAVYLLGIPLYFALNKRFDFKIK
ncbi:MAG: QueT transporter family protein [Clostridia bacterium]